MGVCACDLHVDFIAIIIGIFVGWSGKFWWSFAVFFCKKIKKETKKIEVGGRRRNPALP